MGLDMYLSGKRSIWSDPKPKDERGFAIEKITVELGYWRKHPDLHGFIVKNFGPKDDNGEAVDDCQDIALSLENIATIIEAVKAGKLEHGTTGFFFGQSYLPDDSGYDEQQKEDLEILGRAVAFLTPFAVDKKPMGSTMQDYYEVIYRASW